MMRRPPYHWRAEEALACFEREGGVETACLMVRGRAFNRVFYRRELKRVLGIRDPSIGVKPSAAPYSEWAAELAGHRGLFLVEATQTQRFTLPCSVFFGFALACQWQWNGQSSNWDRVLPVLVVNRDWAYKDLPNRFEELKEEADEVGAVTLYTTDDTRAQDFPEALRAINEGRLPSFCSLPSDVT